MKLFDFTKEDGQPIVVNADHISYLQPSNDNKSTFISFINSNRQISVIGSIEGITARFQLREDY